MFLDAGDTEGYRVVVEISCNWTRKCMVILCEYAPAARTILSQRRVKGVPVPTSAVVDVFLNGGGVAGI
jgi:hypothetical protein